jgi:hypothetical protein
MQRYEYRVVPAPRKGEKARGLKTLEERFAFALTGLMNRMGAEGWDYLRADTLPVDERVGLTGSKTSFQSLLVFRRPAEEMGSEEIETTLGQLRVTSLEPGSFGSPLLGPKLGAVTGPTLGAAVQPAGAAPALGPANPDLAAE